MGLKKNHKDPENRERERERERERNYLELKWNRGSERVTMVVLVLGFFFLFFNKLFY